MKKTPSAIVVGVGAELGLGSALSRRFAAERYHVFVASRTAAKVDAIVADLVLRGKRGGRFDGHL